MEISSMAWLSDLGMEDPTLIQESDMDSLNDLSAREWAAAFGQEFQHSFSSDSYSSYQPFTPTSSPTFTNLSMEAPHQALERPAKQLETNKRDHDACSPIILSFGSQNSPQSGDHQSFNGGIISGPMKVKNDRISPSPNVTQSEFMIFEESIVSTHSKRVGSPSTRSPSHALHHVIAERKRREKLSQKFIALSAIIPGLKKVDKASVLSDTIKYIKQLQEKVKTLENENEKKTIETMVFAERCHISSDDDTSSSDENFGKLINESLPEIDARVLNKNIMIRIQCSNQKGVLVKALAEIEKLQLLVLSTTIMPFADTSLDITVVAKMEDQYCMTVEDLIKCIREAITKTW